MPKYLFLSFLCLSFFLQGQDIPQMMQGEISSNITVDLREPLYEGGILSTEKGGVISAPNIRIQAQKICYTKKVLDQSFISTVEAEQDLIVEFGEYVFVGQKLVYDFQKREGVLYQARTGVEPWYFGGEKVELRSDGSYLIYDGFITTSEKTPPEWGIHTKQTLIDADRRVSAYHLQLKINKIPVLWIPSLKANLDAVIDNPIRYRFRWGGKQGPRFGLTYEIFSWNRWKTYVRLDYRLTRGPGVGFETYYSTPDHRTEFESTNYISTDSSLSRPHETLRYRFEGRFKKLLENEKTLILLTYDKISDIDMPSDYQDRDFDLETSEKTQLLVRHQEENWISRFYSRLRVNNFQTVKQELPTFSTHFRPFLIGKTGIIADLWSSASYLNFKYADHLEHTRNYASSRFQFFPTLYRPFAAGPFCLTPEVGGVFILYSNSPHEGSYCLLAGTAGFEATTSFYRLYGPFKHVIQPYVSHHFYSAPTSSRDHFIFDITDGWAKLNLLTFGVKNSIYFKKSSGCVSRFVATDVYAHAFLDPTRFVQRIPKIYGKILLATLPTLRHIIDAAWDFEHQEIDHFNFRSEWTANIDFAVAAEYRYRSAYSWRKVDPENFFLEAFHSEESLRHSPLSDRRSTLLLHIFYRFHPTWACEVVSRHGWNRKTEPPYSEYEVNLLTTIRTAWHLQFSFQHRERDNRCAVYVNVGLNKPACCATKQPMYCYE